MLITLGVFPNYFGMRHMLEPQAQWFSDWVFLNHYQNDYLILRKWTPSIFDFFRYKWLMLQGYAKEEKHHYELVQRDQNKKVTAQERKFLKKYLRCRFESYNEYVEDDELAHFRSSVVINKTIDGYNRPLFPDITESYPDDPRLAYWRKNQLHTGYIPAESIELT